MMNFNHTLFFTTYNELLKDKTFKEVFYEVFIPFLEEIGYLWQTDTISPAHEHFVSYLIKQKVLSETEKVQAIPSTKNDRTYVLFLPLNEIHELGLMYLNYELLDNGYKTIYLGESVPTECLKDLKASFDNLTFISYLNDKDTEGNSTDYIDNIGVN
mgnify:FL=1